MRKRQVCPSRKPAVERVLSIAVDPIVTPTTFNGGRSRPGLRERKKAATRQALHEAVLRLAVEHGLDAVTVDAVADEAHVSRRTFSNYFANKEEALLYGDQMRICQLLETVRARPRSESAWTALTSTARTFYGRRDAVDPRWMAQMQLMRRHPSVAARQMAAQAALERDLAAELATRLPPEPESALRARVLAAVYLATVRTALRLWAEQDGPSPVVDAVMNALDRAAESFA